MFCINCFHPNTSVTNSRPLKKRPQIWRRRRCGACGNLFTTRELPSLADNQSVLNLKNNTSSYFNLGLLSISIYKAFSHDLPHGEKVCLHLAQTVESILSTEREQLNNEDIEAFTYKVLQRYEPLAAMQYAAQHGLLVNTRRRRGRPLLVLREPPMQQ